MKVIFIVICSLFFISCQDSFRESLCETYLTSIPKNHQGVFYTESLQLGGSHFKDENIRREYIYVTENGIFSTNKEIINKDGSSLKFCLLNNILVGETKGLDNLYTYVGIESNFSGLVLKYLKLQNHSKVEKLKDYTLKEWGNNAWETSSFSSKGGNIINNIHGETDISHELKPSTLAFHFTKVEDKNFNKSKLRWKKLFELK